MGKKKTLRDHASGVASTLAPHVETARGKAGPLLSDARDKAGPLLSDARDKAGPLLSDARDKAAPYLSDARDLAAPYLSDARDKAAPYLSDAKDRFTDDVLPVVTAALAAVDDATEDARTETVKRGKAVAAALKGEVAAPEKSHRVRNVLVALGLGGIAYAAVKKLGGRQPSTTWQSSYTPPVVPTPPSSEGPGTHRADADDTAAVDPADAVVDETDVDKP
jgi:vacuolar-type H+-ATPase subunit H